ncbi:LOB domain-containing protein 12 [Hibiscus syriacus]|uniref:LOB domain-containing protein 12 n=1 Tax=Hibiscus syriacus TaxID=106335 RepID=A0A6A3CMD3_HIBSY|nr:LOB domain-containing protein 12 [Hibiscus syriacus]
MKEWLLASVLGLLVVGISDMAGDGLVASVVAREWLGRGVVAIEWVKHVARAVINAYIVFRWFNKSKDAFMGGMAMYVCMHVNVRQQTFTLSPFLIESRFKELAVEMRADAVSSLVYEENARVRDPVYGCLWDISYLQNEISQLQMQLAVAHTEMLCVQMQQESALFHLSIPRL